jgi:hypothetical protein
MYLMYIIIVASSVRKSNSQSAKRAGRKPIRGGLPGGPAKSKEHPVSDALCTVG